MASASPTAFLLASAMAVAAVGPREQNTVFTVVGYECVPAGSEVAALVVTSRSQCRLLCAANPECVAVHTNLNDQEWMCMQLSTLIDGPGQCTTSSCCYAKGEPPPGVKGQGTVLAGEDELQWSSGAKGAGGISTELFLGLSLTCMFLAMGCSFAIARRSAVRFSPPLRPAVDGHNVQQLQRKVESLPMSICRQRGVAALPTTEGDKMHEDSAPAAAGISARTSWRPG